MITRSAYLSELKKINDRVHEMGQEVELQIDKTIAAFSSMSVPMCNQILRWDDHIDQMEEDIEQACINIVVKEAPVASDWRRIATYMRMISDLERIADNCCDIAEYIKRLSGKEEVGTPDRMDEMFHTMRQMIADTVDAFDTGNLDQANGVIESDEMVDGYFARIREEIEDAVRSNPEHVSQYLDYFMISKYVERMADHATSVASWLQFVVKGELKLYFTDRYHKAADEKDSEAAPETKE